MAKTKKSTDVNITAFQILEAITGELPCHASPIPHAKEPAKKKAHSKKSEPGRVVRLTKESDTVVKNPAAVALGRLGGLKGGPARLAKLDPERRRLIASKAARARWAKKRKS